MEEFQKLMLQWTKLDKELKEINKVATTIRKQKEEIQTQLCPLIQENNLEENIFSVPSLQTNVTFKEHKTSETISYKFLEEKFNDYFDTQEDCLKLLQYLKDNRKKETSFVLKSSVLKEDVE
jgi:pyruvate/2-oxoacid:ferredoxin oxidoreductase beta subunit